MTTLHERLLAAISERERLAREATPGPWHQSWSYDADEHGNADDSTEKHGVMGPDARDPEDRTWETVVADGLPREADAAHIAANDPATVLRECDAWRRIVERHYPLPSSRCCACFSGYDPRKAPWPCDDIRDVAAALGVEVDG